MTYPVYWALELAIRLQLRLRLPAALHVVRDTEYALRVLQEHSGWKDVKRSENEKLRKEYFKLFEDTEMKRRMNEHRIVLVPGPTESSG